MAKRGPKPWQKGRRVIPLALIARELDVSIRTVEADYKSALQKLKAQRKFSEILFCVQAVADQERDVLQPASLECLIARGDFQP